MMDDLRIIKSESEIELMKKAGEIASFSFIEVYILPMLAHEVY